MKHYVSIDILKPNKFFKEQKINYEDLLPITSTQIEYNNFIIYTFNQENLKYVKLVKFKNDIEGVSKLKELELLDIEDKLQLMYIYEAKKDDYALLTEHQSYIIEIIKELNKHNSEKASQLLKEYSDYVIQNSSEVLFFEGALKYEQNKIHKALLENNFRLIDHKIDFTKEMSEEEGDRLYDQVTELNKEIEDRNFPAYCDLDFYPFMYKNKLIIRDVASGGTLLICDILDDNNFTWYKSEGDFKVQEGLEDLAYESNHYLDCTIDNELSEINKITEYKDGKIVFATGDIHYLDLIQKTVFNGMVEDAYITPEKHNLSFKQLIKNYTIQRTGYMIEYRNIVDLLEELTVVNGELSYEDFRLMNVELFDKIIQEELSIKHYKADDLNFELSLSNEQIEEINDYLDEFENKYKNEPEAIKFTSEIKNKIQEAKKIKKPKI